MKQSKCFITLVALLFALPTIGQTLIEKVNSTDVIYVSPLKHFNYYGLKLGAGADKDGSYSISGNYEVGDILAVTDPNVSWEITGKVPDQVISEVNELVLNRFKEKFGADKVKSWPDNLYNTTMATFDQKGIESTYYVIVMRTAFQTPVRLEIFEGNTPSMKPMIVGGSEAISITLFEKEKAGKKGKKVVRIITNPFKNMSVTGVDYASWDDHGAAAEEFGNLALKNLSIQIDKAITELFTEMETVM